jgi:hypothetical protein
MRLNIRILFARDRYYYYSVYVSWDGSLTKYVKMRCVVQCCVVPVTKYLHKFSWKSLYECLRGELDDPSKYRIEDRKQITAKTHIPI